MAAEMVPQNSGQVCSCKAEEVILLPCSGGSNCGQIANQVAVKLTEEGVNKNHQFNLAVEEVDLIASRTRESLAKTMWE